MPKPVLKLIRVLAKTGGFPCQPFSIAGRKHGFEDPKQGNLFFYIKEILSTKRPKAFLLENVKNLLYHDREKTFRIIREVINNLHYDFVYRVINAIEWLPQNRERIYIVGFDKDIGIDIDNFCNKLDNLKGQRLCNLEDILLADVDEKYTLGEKTWNALKRHKSKHQERGHGFGYTLITYPFSNKNTRTLSARYHNDGAEILIEQKGKRPRRLTPLECCRLMGFPKKFEKFYSTSEQPVSDTQAYRQFGNSVAVPVIENIAKLMLEELSPTGSV